jgi:hypothetical protein
MEYKKDFFKNNIGERFKLEGTNIYENSYNNIIDVLNNNDDIFVNDISVNTIIPGKFYFMLYDINGKTSNIEKFNPILAVDWIDRNGTRMLYGLSINFIPVAIRIQLFNNIFNFNISVFNNNENEKVSKQQELVNINFLNIYNLTKSIGFEWAIREFDLRLVNKLTDISFNLLSDFITMSTHKFTGVDDGKLMEIWMSKINKQDERETELIKKLLGDYDKMNDELMRNINNIDDRNANLEKSYNIIKRIYK